jgi:hypothetical protein
MIIKNLDERKSFITKITQLIKDNSEINKDNMREYFLLSNINIMNFSIYEIKLTSAGLIYFSTIEDDLVFVGRLENNHLEDVYNHLYNDIKYKLENINKF